MQIREIMTSNVEYIPTDTSLRDAAERMDHLDTGFLPIGNLGEGKLRGVVTDRDIAIRGVGKGLDPNRTTVEQVKTDKVLYCYEDETLEDAARYMGEQRVYRLVVLDNEQNKKMTGVISLADIARESDAKLAGRVTTDITQ
jgi:CBS domain-containing protein